MNISKNKKAKEERDLTYKKDLFHAHYRIERSIISGLILMSIFWLTGTMSGDNLIGIFLAGAIFAHFYRAFRFPIDAYPKHSCQKFHNSINELIVATADSGLELIQRSDDLYIFKTKHHFFWNGQILIKDCKEYCEVMAVITVLECLGQHMVSRKV